MKTQNLPITSKQVDHYKAAGYSHYISYRTRDERLGSYVFQGFPTTEDAYELHLRKISEDRINNVSVEIFVL